MFEKKCLETGELIYGGRSDKRFINSKARSTYNNKIQKNKSIIFKEIDKQLHLNHQILEKYYLETKGEKGVYLPKLIREGFEARIYLGPPIGPIFENRPNVYYSYVYKYTYDKESREITIKKIRIG